MTLAYDYDVIVIGCGTAGSKAAATAHGLGARVLAVDGAEELGGLCILRGCMPTKTLLETAHRAHEIRDAARFGLEAGEPRVDFPAHMERMRQLVARFQRAKVGGIERAGYELRRAQARFLDPHTVAVDGQRVTGRTFVIATGSRSRPMPVPGPAGAPVVTSDEVFELEAAPRRAVVIGGGAVGLELAQWLARVGSRVTLASRSPLLHREDPELGLELTRALADEMEVCVPSRLVGLEPAAGGAVGVRLACAEGAETVHEADLVLNATGREPALEGLGVEEAFGLDPLDLRVGLHPTLQTKLPHVFLAGDASSRREILHEANIEGELAGRNAARVAGVAPGSPEPYDDALPTLTVIFTDPVFATVGLTPGDCEAAGVPYEAALKRLPEQGRGIVHGLRYGGVRVLADPRSGALIGCQVLSDRADDLIHIPATAIAFGATVEALWRRVPWYHPTQAEAFIEVFRELSQRLGRS